MVLCFQDPTDGQAQRHVQRPLHELAGDHDQEVAAVPFGQRQPDLCPHLLFLDSNEKSKSLT